MMNYVERADLQVAAELAELVENEILLNVTPQDFWQGYADILRDLAPKNRDLLAKRDALQSQIDAWHRQHGAHDAEHYQAFLTEIGYLLPAPPAFEVDPQNVDPEIATMAGPQLVVPVMNARFALNAANARWGSLYDALYGTDAIPGTPEGKDYDPKRGAEVIAWGRRHLDAVAPLKGASWADITALAITDGALTAGGHPLADPGQFAGSTDADVFLRVNGLLIQIKSDAESPIGKQDRAGISDLVLESALTAIQDCEDSVAAVDAADKVIVYRNWLGLMRGDLVERFTKGGRQIERRLNDDITFTAPDGTLVSHPGRAVQLVRNVGHLMTTEAVLLDGAETPEGIMDAVMTAAAAMHDLAKQKGPRNSRTGSIYVVKPKMHGPEECAFTDDLYGRVEKTLSLPRYTVKIGIMDEERRTSVNLAACIHALRHRCVFINTGFLDRTGDEIHTSMHAGPMLPKGEMKSTAWLRAYEAGNVDTGLACGLQNRGQIGKGMWARPDDMAAMLDAKSRELHAGASTAWVPSPTAATLHATHYHQVNVAEVQAQLKSRSPAARDELLTLPLLDGRNLSDERIQTELDNSVQSILGYVVRWVNQGVGCSKVPDIDDVGLMEDRATLRISAQHLANWLLHGLITPEAIDEALRRLAVKVDQQNAGDPGYRAMAPDLDGPAFNAARDLILQGAGQPSGYTEPLLHAWRKRAKA